MLRGRVERTGVPTLDILTSGILCPYVQYRDWSTPNDTASIFSTRSISGGLCRGLKLQPRPGTKSQTDSTGPLFVDITLEHHTIGPGLDFEMFHHGIYELTHRSRIVTTSRVCMPRLLPLSIPCKSPSNPRPIPMEPQHLGLHGKRLSTEGLVSQSALFTFPFKSAHAGDGGPT